jgi:cyclopropane-fatty-acyl-phospholipid synthase
MYLKLLEHGIKDGIINLYMPDGSTHRFGDHGLEAHWYIKDERCIKKIAKDWEWQLGETYVNGGWDTGNDDLRNLLFILRSNFAEYTLNKWLQPFAKLVQQWNRISRSYSNVTHHYDREEDFFRLFLDQDMHYSCAYFPNSHYSLEQAQQAKCQHIANKLLLEPGQTVLDIGCGWGSLACYLAQTSEVEVVGITLSREQLTVAKRRAKEKGLNNVRFELQDYREHEGFYDRIVSVGMFEHVGTPHHKLYFECIRSMLRSDGVALVHSIGRSTPPGLTNPWIRKYIFPGGSVPALSEMARGVENADLLLTDIEVLRLHYAQTLREWHGRFQRHRGRVREQISERFCRMWEFYLVICEVAFQSSDLVVFQLQLTQMHDVVPPTRDYQYVDKQDFSAICSQWNPKRTRVG